MASQSDLISTTKAQDLISAALGPLPASCLPLAQAGGRVLREPVIAEREQPPFNRVMMDGIAINTQAYAAGLREYPIEATQAAGQPPHDLQNPNACIEIMTGAVLPPTCDTVIPVERISVANGIASLENGYTLTSGQHIHRQGSDYPEGKTLLQAGVIIRAPEMAVIASAGMAQVHTSPQLSAGIISLGDELIQPGQPIEHHQIRRSNDFAVAAAIESRGDLKAHCHPVADNANVVIEQINKSLAEDDLLILCGGVSKGKFDFVPDVLAACGVKKIFHRIAQRPGKPFWFGLAANGKPVFALPGNPVSVLACAARYVLPALEILRGAENPQQQKLPLASAIEFEPPMAWLLAVKLELNHAGELVAKPQLTNTSGDFAGLSGSDGIVELPAGQIKFPAGYRATYYPWGGYR